MSAKRDNFLPPALSVVASIEEFAERYSVPKPFIGLILLPIVVSECQVLFIRTSQFILAI